MANTPKVLISGNITELEIKELQNELSNENINIDKLQVKSQTIQDIIQLVLQDFNLICFTRDFVLSGIVKASYSIVNKVVKKLEKKNKKIGNVGLEFEVSTKKGKPVIIKFNSKPENFELLISQVDKIVTIKFIDELTNERQVFISIDSDKKINIKKF